MSRLCAISCLLLLLSVSPAALAGPPPSAIEPQRGFVQAIRVYPFIPTDSVPTWLHITTNDLYMSGSTPPMARLEGQTIQVLFEPDIRSCPWWNCSIPMREIAVYLGTLEAGTYQLGLYSRSRESLHERILRDSYTLRVVPGPTITFSPEVAAPTDTIEVGAVFGSDACPRVHPARVLSDRVVLPVSLGDCSAINTSVTLPPLAAGVYPVELVVDNQVYARRDLVVQEAPRPLLHDGRFELNVTWKNAVGVSGSGLMVQPPSTDSALFYFFGRDNWELMVKVLDGCAINGHYWIFAAASTDVEFKVTVKDHAAAREYSFSNPLGQPAGAINDIHAFSCP